jgi:hypothetical protein
MSADGENENHTRGDGSDSGDAKQADGPNVTAPDTSARSQEAPAQKPQGQPGAGVAASGGLLPNKAAEDDPRRWGDQPGSYDHDAWLKEQRPPHWG